MTEKETGTVIIECAIEVHRELDPALLESVYEVALSCLVKEKGLPNERQVPILIAFREIKFDEGFRADLVVCERVIVELKSKTTINPEDRKQIQTHLKHTGLKLGYLLNFGETLLKDGIVRAVNGLEENLCAPVSLREENKFQSGSGINSVTAPPPHRDTL